MKNPILRGFNPDPSIVRVDKDYFIATSTFEWFPGVQIHHSTDLINWDLVARPLNRISQLDMRGVPDSCGVWAPCLSHYDNQFYLVYSNVKSFDGVWKDTPNLLVTAQHIDDEWSDPVFLGSSGFDGSLFHDDDGRKWYISMLVDHRSGKFFGGIILQQYDPEIQRLVGPVHHIFEGSELGKTEGPHLFKKDGFYYLICAEGGTEYGHAVSIARSANITGPYELHPDNPIISAKDSPNHPLQKSGHADLMQDERGDWFITYLVGRPLTSLGRCILGRETALERLNWQSGDWPQTESRERLPSLHVQLDGDQKMDLSEYMDFGTKYLPLSFQSLRIPPSDEWCSMTQRPGFLRLYGRESLNSLHNQSLLARRLQHFDADVITRLEFSPQNFQQMAGMVCYYNTMHYHYCFLSGDSDGLMYIQIITCDKGHTSEQMIDPIGMQRKPIFLKASIRKATLQFYYSIEGTVWSRIGKDLDYSILSDDYVRDENTRYRPAFTGSFIGLCCQDLTGQKCHADFEFLDYQEVHE